MNTVDHNNHMQLLSIGKYNMLGTNLLSIISLLVLPRGVHYDYMIAICLKAPPDTKSPTLE